MAQDSGILKPEQFTTSRIVTATGGCQQMAQYTYKTAIHMLCTFVNDVKPKKHKREILTFMNICTILFLLSNESKAGKPDLILINQRSFCPLLKTWIASWGQTPLLCQKHFIFHERSILLMESSQFNKQIFNK